MNFSFAFFSKLADVQFEVDAGKTSTNVTRLKLMIRDADAFIGIYPFEEADVMRPAIAKSLLDASRYFRLELDLAARSQKPSLIFADSRYGNVLSTPNSVSHEMFSINEIIAQGYKPSGLSQRVRYCS